ncbi:MAG: hypothetical protein Q8P46_00210 [Hyphomicrobiales bacterium]|nr:hypothetical protein [Hyphomicrobiales bacterium]
MSASYVVLTESETVHLVCIRYGDGKPWLRVVAVFPNKDRAESYADIENSMLGDEDDDLGPAWADELRYEHPDQPEPADGLARLLRRPETPAPVIEAPQEPEAETPVTDEDRADVELATERLAEVEEHPETLVPLADVMSEIADEAEDLEEAEPAPPPRGNTKERVAQLWGQGKSASAIAKIVGVNESRVYQIKKDLNLPSRDPVKSARPGPVAKPKAPVEVMPAPQPPATNGASHPEYSRAGVTVTLAEGNEKIAFKGASVPLTVRQAKLCAILLRGAPSPIGLKYIASNLYGPIGGDDAEMRLKHTVGALNGGILAEVELEVTEVKGIGYALAGAEA